MKSCLKSPPSTPGGSMPCTPCNSGNASPGSEHLHLPCLRKTVSFCEKEAGLEEFFEADDWDRTPAPVAPKLSYEYVPSDSYLRCHCFSLSFDLVCGLEPSHDVRCWTESHCPLCPERQHVRFRGRSSLGTPVAFAARRTKTYRAPSPPSVSATALSASSRTAVRVFWFGG